MNNKHLACVLLAAVIFGCVQLTMMMRKKLEAAKGELETAREAAQLADGRRIGESANLANKEKAAAPLRSYLAHWLPKLTETMESGSAKAAIEKIIKRDSSNIAIFNNRSSSEAVKDSPYIPNKNKTVLEVEGDYVRIIGLIGMIEKDMPASRVSSLVMTKGSSKNDVHATMTIEVPMIVAATAAGTPAAAK